MYGEEEWTAFLRSVGTVGTDTMMDGGLYNSGNVAEELRPTVIQTCLLVIITCKE